MPSRFVFLWSGVFCHIFNELVTQQCLTRFIRIDLYTEYKQPNVVNVEIMNRQIHMSHVRKVFKVMQTWPGAETDSGEKSFMPFLVRVVPHSGGSFFLQRAV